MGQLQNLGGDMVAGNDRLWQVKHFAFSDANYSSLSNFFDFAPRCQGFALIFTNQ
jgi:hypothetical protein